MILAINLIYYIMLRIRYIISIFTFLSHHGLFIIFYNLFNLVVLHFIIVDNSLKLKYTLNVINIFIT